MKRRTIGSLTHADFGALVRVAGHPVGRLWAIQHVAAIGDIPEPWTRLTIKPSHGGGSEALPGLPPSTVVTVEVQP
jgi:hypothetical protein